MVCRFAYCGYREEVEVQQVGQLCSTERGRGKMINTRWHKAVMWSFCVLAVASMGAGGVKSETTVSAHSCIGNIGENLSLEEMSSFWVGACKCDPNGATGCSILEVDYGCDRQTSSVGDPCGNSACASVNGECEYWTWPWSGNCTAWTETPCCEPIKRVCTGYTCSASATSCCAQGSRTLCKDIE